jgi:hypothetical protein
MTFLLMIGGTPSVFCFQNNAQLLRHFGSLSATIPSCHTMTTPEFRKTFSTKSTTSLRSSLALLNF